MKDEVIRCTITHYDNYERIVITSDDEFVLLCAMDECVDDGYYIIKAYVRRKYLYFFGKRIYIAKLRAGKEYFEKTIQRCIDKEKYEVIEELKERLKVAEMIQKLKT